MKYIVKNCPAYDTNNLCKGFQNWCVDTCPECADCPIKQKVEVYKKGFSNLETATIQAEILQILQVEEVEE